jgi:Flp pilus assembly protein protease CpaA
VIVLSLVPLAVEGPRSVAAPRLALDVLGGFGGLEAVGVPAVLGPRPVAGGLVAAVVLFTAWWAVGTAPSGPPPSGQPSACGWWSRVWTPRSLAVIVGLTVVVAAWFRGEPHWAGVWASLLGILVSAAIVWLTRIGASHALGREALGFGDVTLMAMAGAWLGWQACLLACCLAVFIGLGHGLAQFVFRQENELPFGPSLCLALMIVVVTWKLLWERAEVFFSRPGELAVVVMAVILLTAVSLAMWQRFRGGRASGQA